MNSKIPNLLYRLLRLTTRSRALAITGVLLLLAFAILQEAKAACPAESQQKYRVNSRSTSGAASSALGACVTNMIYDGGSDGPVYQNFGEIGAALETCLPTNSNSSTSSSANRWCASGYGATTVFKHAYAVSNGVCNPSVGVVTLTIGDYCTAPPGSPPPPPTEAQCQAKAAEGTKQGTWNGGHGATCQGGCSFSYGGSFCTTGGSCFGAFTATGQTCAGGSTDFPAPEAGTVTENGQQVSKPPADDAITTNGSTTHINQDGTLSIVEGGPSGEIVRHNDNSVITPHNAATPPKPDNGTAGQGVPPALVFTQNNLSGVPGGSMTYYYYNGAQGSASSYKPPYGVSSGIGTGSGPIGDSDGDGDGDGEGGTTGGTGTGSGSGSKDSDGDGLPDDEDGDDDNDGTPDEEDETPEGAFNEPQGTYEFPDLEQELEQKQQEFEQAIQQNMQEAADLFASISGGAGSLPCGSTQVLGQTISICLQDYADQLGALRALVLLMAAIMAAFIILR